VEKYPYFIIPVLLGLITLAKPANAQNRYVSLGLGTSQTYRSDLHLKGFPPGTDVTFGGVTWRNAPLVFTPYYVVKYGGYFFKNPHLGLELDFTHNKAIARTEQDVSVTGTWKGDPIDTVEPMENKAQTVRFTNGVNVLSLMALYRFSGRDARLQPYVGLGPSYFIVWSRNTIDGEERYTRYWGQGFGWQAQTGIRYSIARHGALYAELKYTKGPAAGRTSGDGELSTTVRSFHQNFGYAYVW
jgi:lipid A oxidase